MKLYRVNSGCAYFVGTQAEAKRDARQLKCDWELVEVPTDKEGLIAYLNAHGPADSVVLLGEDMTDEEVRQSNTPEAQREAAIRMAPVEPRMPSMPTDTGRFKLRVGNEADQIAEYILDEKTPAFAVSTILGAAMERVERLTRLLG